MEKEMIAKIEQLLVGTKKVYKFPLSMTSGNVFGISFDWRSLIEPLTKEAAGEIIAYIKDNYPASIFVNDESCKYIISYEGVVSYGFLKMEGVVRYMGAYNTISHHTNDDGTVRWLMIKMNGTRFSSGCCSLDVSREDSEELAELLTQEGIKFS